MKPKEKKMARQMRSEGLPLREIAERLGVSKSSVSVWVRDVELTPEQKQGLIAKNPIYNGQLRGAGGNKKKWMVVRKEMQERGRVDARNGGRIHLAGCMLYWAEGYKRNNRSTVAFSNSDFAMMRLFLRFLKECFGVKDDDVALSLSCYSDLCSVEDTEKKWLDELSLPKTCLRKTMVDRRPRCSKRKRNGLLKYGTCKMTVCSVDIMQRIYGAIQEYGDFRNEQWSA